MFAVFVCFFKERVKENELIHPLKTAEILNANRGGGNQENEFSFNQKKHANPIPAD